MYLNKFLDKTIFSMSITGIFYKSKIYIKNE